MVTDTDRIIYIGRNKFCTKKLLWSHFVNWGGSKNVSLVSEKMSSYRSKDFGKFGPCRQSKFREIQICHDGPIWRRWCYPSESAWQLVDMTEHQWQYTGLGCSLDYDIIMTMHWTPRWPCGFVPMLWVKCYPQYNRQDWLYDCKQPVPLNTTLLCWEIFLGYGHNYTPLKY